MVALTLDPIEAGMHVVLSRSAAKKHKTQKLRVGLVTHVARSHPDGTCDPVETFTVEILSPRKGECTCTNKKKHRSNRTTKEEICTDVLGENRHDFTRVENPKIIKVVRDDIWKKQEFGE